MKRFLLWFLFFPLQALLLVVFSLTDLARLLRRASSRPQNNQSAPLNKLCSIVVLNWNGKTLLSEMLPPLLHAVERTGNQHQVLVVDNGSTDGSVSWLQQNFPQVDILRLDRNLGFAEGNNRGVQAANHDIVVLLNNDMLVDDNFLEPLLEPFSHPEIFAVSSQIEMPEGKLREETGNTSARLDKGYLHLQHQEIKESHYKRRYLPVLWAGGGSSAFHRQRFLDLGGFSSLFSPCYVEDTDLSYRAWQRGWRILFAPESRVLHRHRSTSSLRFTQGQLEEMIETRKLWYLWKNYQLRTLLPHFLCFPINLTHWLPVATYLKAFKNLPRVLRLRFEEPVSAVSDASLLQWTSRPLSFLNEFHPERHLASRNPARLRILIVSAYLPHLGTHGGAGRVFQLLRRVATRHEVSLITFLENPSEDVFLDQVKSLCHRVETVLRRDSIPVSLFPYEPFEEFYTQEFQQRMEDLLAAEDFDLVHFEWAQMAQYAPLVPTGVVKFLTEIEVNYAAYRTFLRFEPNLFRKVRKLYNTLQTLYRELQMCRNVDQVVCVTQEDRHYLEGFVPEEKLKVVNTGVDPEYFQFEGEAGKEDTLVFVGAFRHAPNVDAMLYFCREIFPLILEECPQTRLLVVGSSPPPVISALGQSDSIHVTGYIEDIRDAYREARVVVVPIRTGVGIRGKVLEAWAAGRPVVASRLACQGLYATHGENVVLADHPLEFAAWVVALLKNPDFCQRMTESARRLIMDHYDWKQLGSRLMSLYESAADLDRRQSASVSADSPSRRARLTAGRNYR